MWEQANLLSRVIALYPDTNVGAGLPAIAVDQSMYVSTEMTPSRASPLPHFLFHMPDQPMLIAGNSVKVTTCCLRGARISASPSTTNSSRWLNT